MTATDPRVFVVVLNWNGLADTLECLESLGHLNYPGEIQILVVDNDSEDGSVGAIRARHPEIIVIENSRNLGYTGGNDVGLQFAWAEGADYTWLLNNDTTVDPDCLSRLIRAGEASSVTGLLSPGVWDPVNDELHWAGTVLDLAQRGFIDVVEAERRRVSIPEGPLLLWGTGLLIKRVVADVVGRLDARYFAYVEDFDYSLRTIKAGLATLVVRDAVIFHKASQSLGELSSVRHYLLARNRYLFWRSHLGKEWTWRETGRRIAEILGEAVEWTCSGRQELSRACLDAAWDGLRGHFGDAARKGRMPWILRKTLRWHPYLWVRLLQGRYGDVLAELGIRAGPKQEG